MGKKLIEDEYISKRIQKLKNIKPTWAEESEPEKSVDYSSDSKVEKMSIQENRDDKIS